MNNPLDWNNFAASLREAARRFAAKQIYYTVLTDKEGFPVKYLEPPTYQRKTFAGPFADPGEASQEFKAQMGGDYACYLEPDAFESRARALEARRKGTAEHREMI